jgi:DNA-binding transcriptional MerR regulator
MQSIFTAYHSKRSTVKYLGLSKLTMRIMLVIKIKKGYIAMKMQKRKFRIGELAQKLELERFVVRFWEKEFSIKTKRSQGCQRFYDENDLKKFELIKRLLYEEGFTIVGAKKKLKEKFSSKGESIIASQKTTMEEAPKKITASPSAENEKIEHLSQQIIDLKNKLRKLREML